MSDRSERPREDDAVLGGKSQVPFGAVVLGGLPGVKHRLTLGEAEHRIAAIAEAIKYGSPGLDLVIQALLTDRSRDVQRAAYLLLKSRTETQCQSAIAAFNPYPLFQCLKSVKALNVLAIGRDADTIASIRSDRQVRIWALTDDETLYLIPKVSGNLGRIAIAEEGEITIRTVAGKRHNSGCVVEIWESGELLYKLYGHEGEVSAIALNPDETLLATGSIDTTIKLWNLEEGKLICTFSDRLFVGAHTRAIVSLAFTPDGNTLISSSYDGTIKLWNLQTRERPRTIEQREYGLQSLVVNPIAKIFAGVGWNGQIILRNLKTGEILHKIYGHDRMVNRLLFSPNGLILASASNDYTVKFWNCRTGQEILTLIGHEDAVTDFCFSEDGQSLISASADKTIKIWGIG